MRLHQSRALHYKVLSSPLFVVRDRISHDIRPLQSLELFDIVTRDGKLGWLVLEDLASFRECALMDHSVARPFTAAVTAVRVRQTNVQGKVKWFNNSKGYGFIGRDEGPDIFVHYTAIVGDGYRTLQEGDSVEFEIVQGPKGRQASNVVVTNH